MNQSMMRLVRDLREQAEAGVQFIEIVQRTHLGAVPVGVPLDDRTRAQVREFVLHPLITSIERLRGAGLFHPKLDETCGLLASDFSGTGGLLRAVVAVACVRATAAELLTDTEAPVESAVEIAFAHLQRLLVVDDQLRSRWKAALGEKGEAECERLGGVHLLHHGLWGFKTDAKGERSDLVLGEPAAGLDPAAVSAAKGVVLTEWKRTRSGTPHEVEQLAGRARKQLAAYSGGHLIGLELRRVRYVVIVSERQVALTPEVVVENFRVRQINVAVAPAPPSKA